MLLVEGKIANQKKVKQFFTELKELDNSLSETLKKLFRLEQMIQLAQSDQSFDKEKMKEAAIYNFENSKNYDSEILMERRTKFLNEYKNSLNK